MFLEDKIRDQTCIDNGENTWIGKKKFTKDEREV
jgi:hypothetical protein